MPKRKKRRSDFDSPWKEALEYFLAAFLELFFPHVFQGIDWGRGYVSLDKELHQIVRMARTRKALADKLFRVWRRGGDEAWLLIHVEVQGDPEHAFPLRIFRYNTRAFDRYNRPVVSMAVLTDDRVGWRPDRFEYGDWDASTSIRFLVTKLSDWRGREAELEASANPFAAVILAHLRAIETRFKPRSRRTYKIQLIKGLYNRGWTADDVRQLFRVIDWLLELPRNCRRVLRKNSLLGRRNYACHTSPAWSVLESRKDVQKDVRKGFRKGFKKGFKKESARR